jgi:hypothetical protein
VAKIHFTISPQGRVSSARVTGSLAGTPVAGCLERVMRSASYSAFDGPPLRLIYPVPLRSSR